MVGLVDHIKDVADRLALDGFFVALAPDLYHGAAAKSPDDAGKLFMALNIDRAEKGFAWRRSDCACSRRDETGKKVGTVDSAWAASYRCMRLVPMPMWAPV
jgi:carboxymethylenebutenolidase